MGIEYYFVNETKQEVLVPENANGFKLGEFMNDGDFFSVFIRLILGEWRNCKISLIADATIYYPWSEWKQIHPKIMRE